MKTINSSQEMFAQAQQKQSGDVFSAAAQAQQQQSGDFFS